VAKLFRKFEKVFLICLLVVVMVTFSITAVAALSYEAARENKLLRNDYVKQITKEYPPPIESVDVEYTTKNSPTATMTVGYRPFFVGELEIKLGLTLTVYPQAFEEYSNKDDFISTIHHEYNHLRALSRDYVVEENSFYMVTNNEKTLTQLANSNFNDKGSKVENLKIYSNIIGNLKWSDLIDHNNYDSEALESSSLDEKRQILTCLVRNPIMEMLAIEEEIYRHKFGLNPSAQFRMARYFNYSYYYKRVINGLEALNASPKLVNTIQNLFYRDWIENKNKNQNKIEYALNLNSD
jgi:hypothetical protein